MKTTIHIHKEEKYFVATDPITNIADQGLTEKEALTNLKNGLKEHHQILMEKRKKVAEHMDQVMAKTTGKDMHMAKDIIEWRRK